MRWLLLLMLVTLAFPIGCGDRTEARLVEVRALQDSGEFDGSIETLREILAAEPDHAEANYRLGMALAQTGHASPAIWPLEKAAQSEDYDVSAGLLLAALLLQGQTFEEAIRAADRVLARQPDELSALHIRGQARLGTGGHEEALADAERMLELEPDHFQGLVLRGLALLEVGSRDEAEAALLAVRERSEYSDDPGPAARACAALAEFYQRQEEEERADAAFRGCLETYPGDPLVAQMASDFFDAGGDPQRAISVWRDAVELQPDVPALRVGYAARLQRHGRLEETGAVLAEAAERFDSVDTWSRLAVFQQRRGHLEQARQAIERALARPDGQSPELRFRHADLLVSQGELERAEELTATLDEAVYRDLIRGRILMVRGRYAEAYAALDAGLEKWPNNAGARYLAGQAAEAGGRLKQAIDQYREAVRADAKATDAALAAARLYHADGRFKEALEFTRLQVANRPFASPEPYRIGVRASSALGHFDAAGRALDALARLPGQAGVVLLERVGLARRVSGPEAAVRIVEEAGLDLTDTAHHAALRFLVADLLALERFDEALALATRARDASPDTPRTRELRARVLARTARFDEAREEFEAALVLDPEFAGALDGLGRITGDAGDIDEAVALLDRAAAGSDGREFDSGYRAAQLRLAQGEAAEAEARLREVVRINPGHPGAGNDLAWLLAERGQDLELAEQLAERAVRNVPSAELYDTLGWVQLKRGLTEAAISSLEASLASAPSSPSVRYRLGLAFRAEGRDEEALAAFRKAAGGPPFPELEAVRAEIARFEAPR